MPLRSHVTLIKQTSPTEGATYSLYHLHMDSFGGSMNGNGSAHVFVPQPLRPERRDQ